MKKICTLMGIYVGIIILYVVLYQIMYFLIYLGIISLATFIIFGLDKYKAKKSLWRLSEKQLLIFVALGGGLGALAGMEIFRHKTIKGSFLWKFWLLLILWVIFFFFIINNFNI